MLNKTQGSDLKPLMEGCFLSCGVDSLPDRAGGLLHSAPILTHVGGETFTGPQRTWERQLRPNKGMISLSN